MFFIKRMHFTCLLLFTFYFPFLSLLTPYIFPNTGPLRNSAPQPRLLSDAFSETLDSNSTGVARWHSSGRSHGCLIPVLPREPAALRELP